MIWKMSVYCKAHLTSATHALRLIQKVVGQNVRVNTCNNNRWHHRPGHDQDKVCSVLFLITQQSGVTTVSVRHMVVTSESPE